MQQRRDQKYYNQNSPISSTQQQETSIKRTEDGHNLTTQVDTHTHASWRTHHVSYDVRVALLSRVAVVEVVFLRNRSHHHRKRLWRERSPKRVQEDIKLNTDEK